MPMVMRIRLSEPPAYGLHHRLVHREGLIELVARHVREDGHSGFVAGKEPFPIFVVAQLPKEVGTDREVFQGAADPLQEFWKALHDICEGELMEPGQPLVFGNGRRVPHGVLHQGEHPARLKVGDVFEAIEDLAANGVWGRSEVLLYAVPDGGKEVRLFAGRVLDAPVEFRQVAKHLRQADRRELLVHLLCEPGQPALRVQTSLVQHMVGKYVGGDTQ